MFYSYIEPVYGQGIGGYYMYSESKDKILEFVNWLKKFANHVINNYGENLNDYQFYTIIDNDYETQINMCVLNNDIFNFEILRESIEDSINNNQINSPSISITDKKSDIKEYIQNLDYDLPENTVYSEITSQNIPLEQFLKDPEWC